MTRHSRIPGVGRLALLSTAAVLAGWVLAADEAPPPGVAAALKGHTESVYAVGFTPDGKHVLTGSFDRSLKMFETATGKEVKTFAGPQGHQNLVLARHQPRRTAGRLGSSDNTVKVWDIPTSTPLRDFAHADAVNGVALSADGTSLGAGRTAP
jgi:WD40 repeat protein